MMNMRIIRTAMRLDPAKENCDCAHCRSDMAYLVNCQKRLDRTGKP